MKYTVAYWIFCAAWGICAVLFFFFPRVKIEEKYENKEVVLVTGASCGIGAQIASVLASRGGKVIWTARDVDKAQRTLNDIKWTYYHGERGYVMYLDLASKRIIRKFVEDFKKREKKLNCIVLNAAYHGPRRVTADGFEQNIGVNHLGHMYLVYLLLDMLKESAPSRIVVVSSDLHKLIENVRFDDLMYERDYTPFGAYNHSKVLNILFARELARRMKGTSITVHAAHPGTPIHSELMRNSSWMSGILMDYLFLPALCWFFCRSTYEGAQTPVYCAVATDCAKSSGKYYENLREASASKAASDDNAAARLWDMSCDLLEIPRDWQ